MRWDDRWLGARSLDRPAARTFSFPNHIPTDLRVGCKQAANFDLENEFSNPQSLHAQRHKYRRPYKIKNPGKRPSHIGGTTRPVAPLLCGRGVPGAGATLCILTPSPLVGRWGPRANGNGRSRPGPGRGLTAKADRPPAQGKTAGRGRLVSRDNRRALAAAVDHRRCNTRDGVQVAIRGRETSSLRLTFVIFRSNLGYIQSRVDLV